MKINSQGVMIVKTLSNFLEVEEGVEFKINDYSSVYMIKDNLLMFTNDNKHWYKSSTHINELVNAEITILPQQILTDEEKNFLKTIIKHCSKEVNSIYRSFEGIIDFDSESNGNIETVISIKLSEKGLFKNLKTGKPYTIADLGLEE